MLPVMPVAARGPLAGVVMEQLAVWLAAERYSVTMVPQVLAVARGLSAWLEDHDVSLAALNFGVLESFQAEYALGVPGHGIVAMRVPAVRRFLVEEGHLPAEQLVRKRVRGPSARPAPSLGSAAVGELDAWGCWQREARGISPGCIRHRRDWVGALVDSLPATGEVIDWGACDVAVVNAFIVERAAGLAPASRAAIVDATRSLLRWALATGRIEHDLTGGILRARSTRATLPRGLTRGQVDALLSACDLDTTVGVRDRAVLTTLWRLGLRARGGREPEPG